MFLNMSNKFLYSNLFDVILIFIVLNLLINKSWVVECSNDKNVWVEMDGHENSELFVCVLYFCFEKKKE